MTNDFGELGETEEQHELKRVRGLIGDEPPAPPSVPEVFQANSEKERSLMVQAVTTEVTRSLGQLVAGLQHDIQANTELMRMMDVPIESIVNAHERATASFETLRVDVMRGGLDKLEKVLDTSGLTEQATKAEQRMEAMIARLEGKIDGAFKSHAADMVKILHLLERLQARELADAKKRAKK
jgi:hypothetical protein